MIKDLLHKNIIEHKEALTKWFEQKKSNIFFPFYSSFDIRDSGHKIAPVDANIFPAGFNNICEIDRGNIPAIAKEYLLKNYKSLNKVILLTEEHTKNMYYWDNITTLKKILESIVKEVVICVPGKNITQSVEVENSVEEKIKVHILKDHLKGADLTISNNDFSTHYDIPSDISINPPYLMGWENRKKDKFFIEYNKLATEMALLIGVDPWHLTIETQTFEPFDPEDPDLMKKLKARLESFLGQLKDSYKKYNETPFAFLKNISGTYGLGVTSVDSPDEVNHWTYKVRKKMKAGKGGSKFKQLLLQEGIPTSINYSEQGSSEPVIYMIGADLIGGFLRTHKSKGVRENLNSPGSVYRQLCVSDLMIEVEGHNEENVYGWIAKLSALALAFEIKHLKES